MKSKGGPFFKKVLLFLTMPDQYWKYYHNFDRKGELAILKSLAIYHKGGRINVLRALIRYNRIRSRYSCNVFPSVTLGKNASFVHCQGITIGKTAIIGDNCRIYPQSSIVASVVGDELRGWAGERRHARIGDNCVIGAASLIIGAITIGDDVFIGAGAVVTKDVPSHSVVKKVNEVRPKRQSEVIEKDYGDDKIIYDER